MMYVKFPIYVPVRMQEDNSWSKEQQLRTRKIHKLLEEKDSLGWRKCFDVPAFFSGIVCSVSPDFKIGGGLINLSILQGLQFQKRFNYTTDRILEILETGDVFEEEDELTDLLWGRRIILEDGNVWRMKNDEDGEDD